VEALARGANLKLSGDRVLVHVDVVLIESGHDEFVTLGLHPCRNERGQIQAWVAVQHELVADDLVRRILGRFVLRYFKPSIQQQPAHSPLEHVTEQDISTSQRLNQAHKCL